MVCKVESFCWKQGQTNGKNNLEHILSLQGVKYVLYVIPIYTCIPKQSKFKFALLNAMEQSAHPTQGLDASKASYYFKQPFQGKDVSPPPRRLESEARVLSLNAAVFRFLHNQKGSCCHPGGMQGDMLDPSIASPLHILSESNFCLQQQHFHSAEQSIPNELQESSVLHAKYQGLINTVYFSWCG